MKLTDQQLERFWSKVNKNGPVPTHRPDLGRCWVWTGGKARGGYGHISMNNKLYRAPRLALLIANGKMPDPNLDACHACDNPACVRPDHISECTRSENMQHAAQLGRIKSQKQKLTEDDVLEIRRAKGKHKDIASRYGLHDATVGKIKNRVIWKNI